jgi:hypothetical protein
MGLLWYDGDPKKNRLSKIDDAVIRFNERFGHAPNACHVNPRDLVQHDKLSIVANPLIQPNHYWVGIEDEAVLADIKSA